MAKLTRTHFLTMVDGLWGVAKQNFDRDKALHGCLIGVDIRGRQTVFIHAEEGDPRALNAGMHPLPGAWSEHLDEIRATFTANKVVAAVVIGEAWMVTGETARETTRLGLAPHEHPMKDEVVSVSGFWPREFVAVAHQARIVRDEHGGTPRLEELEAFLPETDAVALRSWVEQVLPAAH